jgi:TM2 domain-containing membrane protein YozV
MGLKWSDLVPCVSFFAAGRPVAGIVTLLMQLSIIFWPAAAIWARRAGRNPDVDRKLAEFAEVHKVDPYMQPAKKFRQAA